jgi:hypothetical protein
MKKVFDEILKELKKLRDDSFNEDDCEFCNGECNSDFNCATCYLQSAIERVKHIKNSCNFELMEPIKKEKPKFELFQKVKCTNKVGAIMHEMGTVIGYCDGIYMIAFSFSEYGIIGGESYGVIVERWKEDCLIPYDRK